MEGEPASQDNGSFKDLTEDWYLSAVCWAAEHGIVRGYGDHRFGPGDDITREQLAAILMRYAVYKGCDIGQGADLSSYADAILISGWALEAMAWASGTGLLTGRTATTLTPNGTASRAEMATVLARLTQKMDVKAVE